MIFRGIWLYLIAIYLNLYGLVDCGIYMPKEMNMRRDNGLEVRKRPFCNAFTGCGKKRSLTLPYNALNEINGNDLHSSYSNNNNKLQNNGQPEQFDSSLSDLIDLNSEPAVEDLMRQIMSQAKLWEAIQEASREIQLQKQHEDHFGNTQSQFPTFNAQ